MQCLASCRDSKYLRMCCRITQCSCAIVTSTQNLVVLDAFQLEEIKTKNFVEIMNALEIENALIVIPKSDEKLEKSSHNVPGYKVMATAGLNVYDILLHKKIVLLQDCLGQLEERLLS